MVVATVRFYTRGVRAVHKTEHLSAVFGSITPVTPITGSYSPHSFRASGLTRFLEEGGTLEGAQNIADHANSRTTKLYDRRQQIVLREDVERIRY
jgi:site-specific recombinase XerD